MIINFIDYIDIIGGGTPKTNVIEYWNGDIPWLSIDDFKECNYYVYSTNKFITNLGLKNSTTNLLHKNDIIISARGTVGKIALIYKDMAFNQSCFGLRVKRSKCSELNPVFLFYYLKANLKYLLKVKHDSIFDTINLESFKYIKLNLPPKYIQDKIADILSNIDNQIKRNDTMIERLQDMILTRYSIMFQDKTNKNGLLKDICLLPSGYNFKPEIYNNYGEYKLITIKNVWDTFIDDINTDKISDVPSIKDYCYLRIGDILLSLTGNVGRISIVHSKNNLLNQRVSLLQAKENYKIYSYCLLKSQEYQFIMTNIARGTSQKNLSPIDVENLKIYVPTLEEIKVFNEKTENYFNEMLTIKQSTDKLIILKEKLLPLLINGQLNI